MLSPLTPLEAASTQFDWRFGRVIANFDWMLYIQRSDLQLFKNAIVIETYPLDDKRYIEYVMYHPSFDIVSNLWDLPEYQYMVDRQDMSDPDGNVIGLFGDHRSVNYNYSWRTVMDMPPFQQIEDHSDLSCWNGT